MSEFYIVSLKHSGKQYGHRDFVLFWRPNDMGYTLFLEAAGRYSREDVESNADYYNNGESTIAVPCELAESLAHKAVYSDDFRKLRDARHPNPATRNK